MHFPSRLPLSVSIHHYLSHCPPRQFSLCTLQRKYWMLWTDFFSSLKDCWHLSSAHLNLLLAHFSRAHTHSEAGKGFLYENRVSVCPSTMHGFYDCHWLDFEAAHSFMLAFLKTTSQNPQFGWSCRTCPVLGHFHKLHTFQTFAKVGTSSLYRWKHLL